MIQQTGDGLRKIVIQLIYAVFLCILRSLAGERALAHHQITEILADIRIIREVLRNDVVGTLQGFFNSIDTLFWIYKILCQQGRILAVLGKDCQCQRFQTFFPGHGATGTALLFIRTVQIFHFGHGSSCINGSREFLC